MTRVLSDSLKAGTEFSRFCIIGAFGFAIDAGLLTALAHGWGMDPFLARLASILTAVTATWGLHRRWTFRSSDPARIVEWSRFAAVNGAGAALNFTLYALILLAVPATPPLLALAAGSLVALASNYLGSKLWAFRGSAGMQKNTTDNPAGEASSPLSNAFPRR